jgi:DNA circularisation protein N-terminus
VGTSLPTRQMLCAAENRLVYRRARNGPQAGPVRDSPVRHAVARGHVSEAAPALRRGSPTNLGRRIRQYRLRGHVIGPLWKAARDALISACEDSDQVGTLVHPYLGPLRVRCIDFEVSEGKDAGQIANFELTFAEAGDQPGPSSHLTNLFPGVLAWSARSAYL